MGRKGDPKVPILPSRTRKGTALSTSATLDSPSVMSKFASPPPHATYDESGNMSDTFDDASTTFDDIVHLVTLLRHRSMLLERNLELKFLLRVTLSVKLMIILI